MARLLRAVDRTTGAHVSCLPGDSDDSCDTVILSPTARAVRNVRNVMYLHQEGEEDEEEEEEEEDGEEIEQEHEGKKVVVSREVWVHSGALGGQTTLVTGPTGRGGVGPKQVWSCRGS